MRKPPAISYKQRFSGDLAKIRGADFRQELLLHMFDGETLAEACGALKINPAVVALYRRDNPEFDASVIEAQQFNVDLLVDKLPTINDEIDNPVMAGVISKNIQWLASKRDRNRYGEKMDINHNVTIDIKGAIEDARTRTIEHIGSKPLELKHSYTDNISVEQDDEEEIDPLS